MITEKQLREDKQLLAEAKKYYKLRFKHDFVESCRSCFLDLLSIINYYKKNPQKMSALKPCQFHIKDELGGSFRVFGSDEYFSNSTITDEQCIAFIAKNKKHLGYFDKFPESFELPKEVKSETKPIVNTTNIDFKNISVEDLQKILSIEELKKILDDKGIKYHRNAGFSRLVKHLADENN